MTARYRRRSDLRVAELEGEGVVLHLGSRSYFSVSGTALVILEALAEPCTMEQLIRAVTEQYDVSEAQAAADAREFIDRCVAAELLHVEERH